MLDVTKSVICKLGQFAEVLKCDIYLYLKENHKSSFWMNFMQKDFIHCNDKQVATFSAHSSTKKSKYQIRESVQSANSFLSPKCFFYWKGDHMGWFFLKFQLLMLWKGSDCAKERPSVAWKIRWKLLPRIAITCEILSSVANL